MTLRVFQLGSLADAQELEHFLEAALQVVDKLGELHHQDVVHRGIRPQELLIDEDSGDVALGSPSQSKDQMSLYDQANLREYLPYISPEQTGRMNRSVDYRSDFYSLGATFYELLGGRPPFEGDDPMELIHGHIARRPQRLAKVNRDVPQTLSDIVMKLLAKNAEDRYQSSYGLKVDLQTCLSQWREKRAIEPFALGQEDLPERLTIPHKLYGRQAQVAALHEAFERVAAGGGTELALVAGHAGVGKTTLVQEVHRPIMQQRGYFISGKFDQYQRNVPYASLIQAFRGLVRQILTQSEAQVAVWREKLSEALGPNAQIIIDGIPELALILDPQPPVPELPPEQAQNRFNYVVQRFVRSFASPEHPLVLFLDDLQWADRPSLNLILHLLVQADIHHLLIIGTYRDDEVDSTHPLALMQEGLQQTAIRVEQINLMPLELEDVTQLIAEALKSDAQQARPLAQLCLEKTGGNPLFLIHFLHTLSEAGWLHLDRQHGQWGWEMGAIQQVEAGGDVVDLMVAKMRILPAQTRQVLQRAACIGRQFELETLAAVHGKSFAETTDELQPALKEGLVLPPELAQQFIEPAAEGRPSYRFLHDRVQTAVYTLIPEDQRGSIHLQIGCLLLQSAENSQGEIEETLFDIVGQMNQGSQLIDSQTERDQLVRLNLLAGQRAKAAAAYELAYDYLKAGLEMLMPKSWDSEYDLTLAVYLETAEAAYLNLHYEQMESLLEEVLKHARTRLDEVNAYELQIQALCTQNKLQEAVRIALPVLRWLGVRFPKQPNTLHVVMRLLKTKVLLAGKKIEDLIDLPEMEDTHKQAAMRIMIKVGSAIYLAAPEYLPLVTCEFVLLSTRYGNSSESPFGYAGYGLMQSGALGDIDSGYRFGKLALQLVERLNARETAARTMYLHKVFVMHWKEHLKNVLEDIHEYYQIALETGDLEYGAQFLFYYVHTKFMLGHELNSIAEIAQEYKEILAQLDQKTPIHQHAVYHQTVLNLMAEAGDPCSLIGEAFDERQMLPTLLEARDQTAITLTYLNKMVLSCLFEKYTQALENAAKTESHYDGLLGAPAQPIFHLYDSLVRLETVDGATRAERRRVRRKVAANQKKMKKWAHFAPENYQHKFLLVEAERARVLGRNEVAGEYYDQAIELARQNEYLNEEALALELAAKFYLTSGQPQQAEDYMGEAYGAYSRWGAKAKVLQLEAAYPDLLAEASRDAAEPEPLVIDEEQQPAALEMALPGYTLTECLSEERHVVKYHGFSQGDPGLKYSFVLYKELHPQPAELAQLKATYAKLPELADMGLVEVYEIMQTPEGLVLVLEELS